MMALAGLFFPIPGFGQSPANLAPAQPQPLVGTRFFFNLDLDSRYQIVGQGPLTQEAAATANAYCFTYDPQGRLERIEFRRASRPMADPLFQVARIDFEYAPGLERRWFRNEHGQAAATLDGIYGEELTLNSAGFPLTVTNLNATGGKIRDGSGVISYNRQLDPQNRLVRARRIGLLGIDITDNNGLFETRTSYDDQGRRIEYRNVKAEGTPLNDADGVALTRTSYTAYPNSLAVIETYFDANGVATAEKSSGVHQRQRVFDARGFLLSESYFDVTGAPTLDAETQVHEHRYEYNDQGNLTAEGFFDIDGKPRNKPESGYARVTYEYDAMNRVITKSYFGDDGSPQVLPNLGAAIIRQEYDTQGNTSPRRQFFNGQGKPSLHQRYGAPAIRIQMDGDTTTVLLRDAHDRPMQNVVTRLCGLQFQDRNRPPPHA